MSICFHWNHPKTALCLNLPTSICMPMLGWHTQRAVSQHCDPCPLWATKTMQALFVAISTMKTGVEEGCCFLDDTE